MPVTATPIFPQALLSVPTQFTNATGTTITQILPAKTNGAKVEAILCSSTDTVAHDANLYVQVGGTNYLIGTVSVPATAGDANNVPAVNLITALTAVSPLLPLPFDERGNRYLYLDPSTSLFLGMAVAVTAAKAVNAVVLGGAF